MKMSAATESRAEKKGFSMGIVLAACLMYALSAGLRSVFGIMLNTISKETGIAYDSVSFVIAVGQLMFGIAQPAFGIVALKKSNSFVLVSGCILMALGLAMLPFCTTDWMLMIFFGILLPVGTGAVSFGIIMDTVTPKLGERQAVAAAGIINASSGVGSIVLSPMIQSLFSSAGLKITMLSLAFSSVILIPAAIWIGGTKKEKRGAADDKNAEGNVIALLERVMHSKSYLFLMLGFFTCGFQMAVIQTHLYSQILSYGIADSLAAAAFSVYGFTSVIGSLFTGFFCGRFRMKYVVGFLYGSRVVIVSFFLLLPKTTPAIFVFLALLGMTGAATVVPTAGLVGKLFGSKNLGTLFGFVFLCHQSGSFFSAWLGGRYAAAAGGYISIWNISTILSLCAMIVSFCIAEPRRQENYSNSI
jgi:MFS family permease